MATIEAWHSGAMASMQTHRRRDLRPRPLSASAETLLAQIAARGENGFPREIVAASGIRASWAWSAIAQLQEQKFIELNDYGHVRITRAGRDRARRRAA